MLPKVANQLIHHTSRAVAVVQNQTGHTIRNVLHLQTSTPTTVGNRNGPGSSSSGKGSNGTGAGGARQSGSSRFYNSYSALSRSVTQADPSLLHSATIELADDAEELSVVPSSAASARRLRHRARSHSMTLGVHDAKAEKIGLLQALQQHVRARHAFAIADATSTHVQDSQQQQASIAQLEDVDDAEAAERIAEQEKFIAAFKAAQSPEDVEKLLERVVQLRESARTHDTLVYNEALEALVRTRTPGTPLAAILELYNHMVSRSVVPDVRTYCSLISALTERDQELQKKIEHLEERTKINIALGRYTPQLERMHVHRIGQLRSENNLSSAMLLFKAACHMPRHRIPTWVYVHLLRSCAYRGNVDAALQVFGHYEKRHSKPVLPMYAYLISAYNKHGDITGAKEIFSSFRKAAQSDGIDLGTLEQDQTQFRDAYLGIWNLMITTYFSHSRIPDALGLLEEMVGPQATAEFRCGDIPAPSPATYSRVIKGFIQNSDLDSAIVWFDRLLEQPELAGDARQPSLQPTKPNSYAWSAMVLGLASAKRVEDLNRLVQRAIRENLHAFHPYEHAMIVYANTQYLDSRSDLPSEAVIAELDRLCEQHLRYELVKGLEHNGKFYDVTDEVFSMFPAVIKLRLKHGDYAGTVDLVERFVKAVHEDYVRVEATGEMQPNVVQERSHRLRRFLGRMTSVLLSVPGVRIPLKHLMRWATLSRSIGIFAQQPVASYYVAAYLQSTDEERATLSPAEWHSLFEAGANVVHGENVGHAVSEESLLRPCPIPPFDLLAIIEDSARFGNDWTSIPYTLAVFVGQAIGEVHGANPDALSQRLAALGPSFEQLASLVPVTQTRTARSTQDVPVETPETAPSLEVRIDNHHSRYVEEYLNLSTSVSATAAYDRLIAGTEIGLYPRIEAFARLINALGREKEVEKVRTLYKLSQLVLAAMESDRKGQSFGWFQVEDAMIIALAHAGDVSNAHIHRMRILEQGGSPDADAYGALIERVSNTTDDTENAWRLYQEAVAHGVKPNIYLYNTIISKLAKARKADRALALFTQMKADNLRPTSVTYGALIAACCRVGDAASAEALFQEMTEQPNFKPRVPPFNTMMQLYTQTKPDRARALHYYESMRKMGVKPTAHTYKLLIDAYGAIEPVDVASMEDAFAQLVADRSVPVQGTHWAALINAYGCAKKDLDKAIEIFESIPSHPSTRKAHGRLPDEVVFEALMNVFVRLRRPDLMAAYQARMPALGIRMTAYIANFLIKGYAASGNIEGARALFESLADPPTGVAAPNNHAPHEDKPESPSPILNVPEGVVFREPSTWETMVRAELGHGNREQAIALLQRVQARGFPPAVYNRISGIMPDVSVSPWGSGSEASAPSTP